MSQATQLDSTPDRPSPTTQPLSSARSQAMSDDQPDQFSTPASETEGLWTNTRVWKSFEVQEREKFAQLQLQNRRNSKSKDSTSTPSTFQQFIDHRLGVLEDSIKTLKTAIIVKEKRSETCRRTPVIIMPAFGGKNLEEATRLFASTIPKISVSEILATRLLDSDPEFIATAEYRIGASLLREL